MHSPIFSIYDTAAKAYLPFFVSQTAGTAMRAFSEALNNTGSNFNKYAADYNLYEIGTWNDENGELATLETFINHGNGLAHKETPTLMSADDLVTVGGKPKPKMKPDDKRQTTNSIRNREIIEGTA